ncbi:hypothetical protein KOW79_015468 [Hemibagrus wyckioides]|uniref:Uncharacterized protein n=1 Tax=Hemibagrus wyckioides TaxID=337641 RepID=A0A9D3NDQ9_9TELE|nr:hypothetical protein KOW79_015468 [Hemibagrus wyckioides]
MYHLMYQHIFLGMTAMLLSAGGSDGSLSVPECCCLNIFTSVTGNQTVTPNTLKFALTDCCTIIGLSVMGVLFLLLVCQCTTCIVIMSRTAKIKVLVPQKEDTRAEAGEQDICYSTVKFTKLDKDSDHVTKFEQKSEYATVVINTADDDTPQQDCWDNSFSLED